MQRIPRQLPRHGSVAPSRSSNDSALCTAASGGASSHSTRPSADPHGAQSKAKLRKIAAHDLRPVVFGTAQVIFHRSKAAARAPVRCVPPAPLFASPKPCSPGRRGASASPSTGNKSRSAPARYRSPQSRPRPSLSFPRRSWPGSLFVVPPARSHGPVPQAADRHAAAAPATPPAERLPGSRAWPGVSPRRPEKTPAHRQRAPRRSATQARRPTVLRAALESRADG